MKKINFLGVAMTLVCAFLGFVDASAIVGANAIVGPDAASNSGEDGVGKHVTGATLETDLSRVESPDLIDDPVDRVVVKMYQSAIPIDQFTRSAGYVKQNGMRFSYYAVDTRVVSTTILNGSVNTTPSTAGASANQGVANASIFDVTDLVLVSGVKARKADGTSKNENLVLYVEEVGSNYIKVQAVNDEKGVPTISVDGTVLYRLGHAASEGDVQTAPYSALPMPTENYMQIFKTQTMESTINIESDKKVDWKPTDSQELAIYNMRKEIEATYLFGVKGYFKNTQTRRYVYTTSGILEQILEHGGNVINFGGASATTAAQDLSSLTEGDLIDFMKEIFTGNSGSNERYMFAGSDFVAQLAKLPGLSKQLDAASTFRKFGMKFKTIEFMAWTLQLQMHPILDEFGLADCFFVLDMPLVKKNVFRSLTKDILDLKKAGIYDGDSAVWTEISAVALKYPKCHAFGKPTHKTI